MHRLYAVAARVDAAVPGEKKTRRLQNNKFIDYGPRPSSRPARARVAAGVYAAHRKRGNRLCVCVCRRLRTKADVLCGNTRRIYTARSRSPLADSYTERPPLRTVVTTVLLLLPV